MNFYIRFFSEIINRVRGNSYLQDISLEVYQFTYNAQEVSNPVKEIDFNTNELKIAYATARTLCSYHIDQKEFYFDIVASLATHFNFFEANKMNYLKIKKERYERLRDFSKTSRIGELAQGVNYLFLQDRLDYPYIIDFHLFCKKNGIPLSRKTPDFVVLKKNLRETGLFESKGEGAPRNAVKTKLRGAMNQLNAVTNIYANKLIPVCSRFEYNAKNSSINYCNIDETCEDLNIDDLNLKLFKQHYASWFYLIGDFDRADQLVNQTSFNNLNIDNEQRYTLGEDNKKNEIYWVNRPFHFDSEDDKKIMHLRLNIDFNHRHDFKIGIYKSVVEQLENNILNNGNEIVMTNDEEYQRFADRTIIKVGNKEQKIANSLKDEF